MSLLVTSLLNVLTTGESKQEAGPADGQDRPQAKSRHHSKHVIANRGISRLPSPAGNTKHTHLMIYAPRESARTE